MNHDSTRSNQHFIMVVCEQLSNIYMVAADGQHANGQLVQLSATWQAQQAALQM